MKEVLAMSAVTNEIAIATTERMVLAPARYVLLPVAHLLTGYTVKAMERKIERGDWQEGMGEAADFWSRHVYLAFG